MFIRFSLHQAFARAVSDQPGDPFNTASEYYQTWQIYTLDSLGTDPNPTSNWARQGFSVTGGPDDGVSFSRESRRVLDDPSIAFKIDPESLKEGATQSYQLDLHWWESDSSSQEVRAAFSDATLSVLAKAWQASADKQKGATDALTTWLSTKSEGVVKAALAAAAVTATSWVSIGFQVLPLLKLVVDVMKNQSDDYIGMNRFEIQTKRENGALLWRVIPPGIATPPKYQGVNTLQRIQAAVVDGSGRNNIVPEYACMVLD